MVKLVRDKVKISDAGAKLSNPGTGRYGYFTPPAEYFVAHLRIVPQFWIHFGHIQAQLHTVNVEKNSGEKKHQTSKPPSQTDGIRDRQISISAVHFGGIHESLEV